MFVEVIDVNKSDKDFKELDHQTVSQDFQNFGIDESTWGYILIELYFSQSFLFESLEVHRYLLVSSEYNLDNLFCLLDFLNYNDDLLIFSKFIEFLLIN